MCPHKCQTRSSHSILHQLKKYMYICILYIAATKSFSNHAYIFQQVSRSPEAPEKTPAGMRYKMVVGFIEFDSEFDFRLLVQCSVFQSKTHGCQLSLTVVHITILCCILNRICGIDGLCTYINDHSWAYYTSGQHKVRISLKNTHRTKSLVSYCDLST